MIHVDFGLARLDLIIGELGLQIKFLEEQKKLLVEKRCELARCELLIN